MNRVSIITGTESALGTALADYLYRAGHRVYRLDASRFFPSADGDGADDVTDVPSYGDVEASVSDYVTHVVNREGHLDALVNVAGYGLAGVVETATVDEVHDLYAHHLLLPHAATRAALSVMGVQEHGAIVNVGVFPRRDAQEGHGLYAASLNNLLSYTETLRRELDGSGISARFVQARAADGAYGPDVRWTRLLTLPSLRTLRDRLRRLVGEEATEQTHVQLAHLIEQMIRDPRPVPTLLPGHAVPPSARVQVRAQPPTAGRLEVSPSGELLYGVESPERSDAGSPSAAEPRPSGEEPLASANPFVPPWITFVGAWTEPDRRAVAKAVRAYEAETETPTLSDPYWICSKRAEGPPSVTAHRAGSALLFSAPDVQGLARQVRQAPASAPNRPY